MKKNLNLKHERIFHNHENKSRFALVTPLVFCNSLGWLEDNDNTLRLELVYILAYLNHCLNFLFYGMSCEMYRLILMKSFKRWFSFLSTNATNTTNTKNATTATNSISNSRQRNSDNVNLDSMSAKRD